MSLWRRFDVMMTLLLRRVSAGMERSDWRHWRQLWTLRNSAHFAAISFYLPRAFDQPGSRSLDAGRQ